MHIETDACSSGVMYEKSVTGVISTIPFYQFIQNMFKKIISYILHHFVVFATDFISKFGYTKAMLKK